jgi:hypothetical protein
MIDHLVLSQFDWVKARAACSLYKVFEELKRSVNDDVLAINAEQCKGQPARFFFEVESDKKFLVFCETASGSIDFVCSDTGITVFGYGKSQFTATITLNKDGQCKLRVGSEELEQWQVRRMALEDLFFGPRRS